MRNENRLIATMLWTSVFVSWMSGGCVDYKDHAAVPLGMDACAGQPCVADSDCACNGVDAICDANSTCLVVGCDFADNGRSVCAWGTHCETDSSLKMNVCRAAPNSYDCYQKACTTDEDCLAGCQGFEARCARKPGEDRGMCLIVGCNPNIPDTCPPGIACNEYNGVAVCYGEPSSPATDEESTSSEAPSTIFTTDDSGSNSAQDTNSPEDKFACIYDSTLLTDEACQEKCPGLDVKYSAYFQECLIKNCNMADASTCPPEYECTDVSNLGYDYATCCISLEDLYG